MSPTATHSKPARLNERWARSVGYHAWNMTATRFCIFDMDGVLIDSGAHHRNAWQTLLEELEVTPDEPEYWRGAGGGRPARAASRGGAAAALGAGPAAPAPGARPLALRRRGLYAGVARRGTLAVAGVS